MAGPKPQLRPSHTTGAANGHASRYVSQCSVCGRGIFDWQPHHLSTGRVLGLVHDECPPTNEEKR